MDIYRQDAGGTQMSISSGSGKAKSKLDWGYLGGKEKGRKRRKGEAEAPPFPYN